MSGNLLGDALAIHAANIPALAGGAVTYRRGNSSVTVTAAPGRTDFESYGPDGELVSSRSTDWIMAAADLVLDGVATVPRRGDVVVDATGNEFIVLPVNGERVYRYSDATRKILRVHTVEK